MFDKNSLRNAPETDPSIDINQLIEDVNNDKIGAKEISELWRHGKLSPCDDMTIWLSTKLKKHILFQDVEPIRRSLEYQAKQMEQNEHDYECKLIDDTNIKIAEKIDIQNLAQQIQNNEVNFDFAKKLYFDKKISINDLLKIKMATKNN